MTESAGVAEPSATPGAGATGAPSDFVTLLDGLLFVEAPRWQDDRLVFSDWAAHEAIEVTGLETAPPYGPGEVRTRVVAEVNAFPFCTDRLPDGRLVTTAGRKVLVQQPNGSLETYADLSDLAEPGWNDIVVDGRGNVFVNNVNFEFPGGEFRPGLVAVITPDGHARQVAYGLAFPNGMAVSPDGSTLVVAESYASRLTGFDIAADGSLSGQRAWATLDNANPDGICFDAEGAVWFAEVPGRRCVRVAEGGEVLAELKSDLACFACMLGGPDRRTLYV